MNKSNITVIIPLHELNPDVSVLLNNALKSVELQSERPLETLVVGPQEVCDYVNDVVLKNFEELTIRTVLNDGKTDFASQINLGVENTNTESFSILEFDDEYSYNWFKNVSKYKEAYPDVEVFLPIVVNASPEGGFLGFNNEAVWAAEFSTQLGFLDNTSLNSYQGFNIDGMVMSKQAYQTHGGLKPSMKLTFIYEFLMRITYFNSSVMVIPKLGYRHLVNREGSLFNTYNQTLSKDEARWWMSLAKKEYFHTKDRGITYDKQTV